MLGFAQVGEFCPNERCLDYGKLQSEPAKKNIKKFGKTKAGRQRYQCKTCAGTFTETKGTIFHTCPLRLATLKRETTAFGVHKKYTLTYSQ
jgi:hypothetical protein